MLYEKFEAPVAEAQSQKSPGTVESVEGGGESEVAWAEPDNAKVNDGNYATAASETFKVSENLTATGFGFVLPEGAVVAGVIAGFVKKATPNFNGITRDVSARLVIGGSEAGDYKKSLLDWPESDTLISYGGSADLWGLPSLSFADANSSKFGVRIRAGIRGTAYVNSITQTVYYTEAESEDRICFQTRSIELASDGCSRQARTDDVWGPVVPDGFLPVDSPGGLGSRPSRGILIASRGDFAALADSGQNPMKVIVRRRAGYGYAREGE